MALIEETREEKAEFEAVRIAEWAEHTRSPFHCVTCRRYVGCRHLLHERTPACVLGSEVLSG